MNMSVASTPSVSVGAPSCFGKEWDNREPACAGGADPNFRDEEGKHVRIRCGWFTTCGSVTQSSRLIAPQTLVRPQAPAPAPSFVPTPQAASPGMPPRPMWTPPVSHPPLAPPSVQQTDWQRIEQQRQEGLRRMQVAPPYAQPAPYQQPQPQQFAQMQGPIHYPAQTWQVGYGMPAYLTHEEVRHTGESWWSVFVREIFRGALKALFHSGARYIDVNPFKGPPRS